MDPRYLQMLQQAQLQQQQMQLQQQQAIRQYQQQQQQAKKPAVVVPMFTHATIENILKINQHLIRILLEYQNNGWTGHAEQKIYHQRLQTNLTYLATMADAALKGTIPNIPPVDLSPVVFPPHMANIQTDPISSDLLRLISCQENPTPDIVRKQVVNAVNPPNMIIDPVGAGSKPDPSNFSAIPPFSTTTDNIPGFKQLDPKMAKEQLLNRMSQSIKKEKDE